MGAARGNRFEQVALFVAAVAAGCFVWLAWELTRGRLAAFDETTHAGLHTFASPALTLLMQAATWMGSTAVVIGVTACASLVLLFLGRRDAVWLILGATAGAEMLDVILKLQFHRQRPEPFFDTIPPGSYSFPSGHALFSICVYGLLSKLISARLRGLARWLVRTGAVVLILAIGLSRVYLGVHYPTDVIAGYLVGIAWIATLLAIQRRLGSHR